MTQVGEYRFIHYLSYPYDKETVNTYIPRQKASVQYRTVDDAVSHIKELGSQAHLAKTDIKLAFRIIPNHPEDFRLLGIKLDDKYYYDTTPPMGCSMSCAIFEAFSTNKLGIMFWTILFNYSSFVIQGFYLVKEVLEFLRGVQYTHGPRKDRGTGSNGQNVRSPELNGCST